MAQEEQYILRVLDSALAAKLRGALREDGSLTEQLKLSFPENGRQGTLTVEGSSYPVHVLDLPTTVESYKTYDDTNLVKAGDVGQILLVGAPPAKQQAEINRAQEKGGPGAAVESLDGITPPMRSARSRHLRPRVEVPPDTVRTVEEALIDILDGHAPAGMEFEDHEEEFVVEEGTGKGRWRVAEKRQPAAAAQQAQLQAAQPAPSATATTGSRGTLV